VTKPAPPPKAGSKAGPAKKVGKRFTKGASGNPRGMKKGTKHRRTLLLAEMSQDDRAAIVEKIIKQALRGCRVSQRMIQDRIEPVRRARLKFKLRPMATIADVVAAFDDIAAAVASGELTLDEAAAASIFIEKKRDAIETYDHEVRLKALEAK
jgi:uncharacterized protein YqgV (UPF0045/DUF77 family)